MKALQIIVENIKYSGAGVSLNLLLAVLIITSLLSLYEFLIYSLVSKRSVYNRSFNIAIVIIPYFISTIILCLQSNMVITLGTIGALAIIRFRTAIKDPVDMIYLLWSIHTGIMTGCQLFLIGIVTSVAVTIVLIVFTNYSIFLKNNNYTLVVRTEDSNSFIVLLKNKNFKNVKIVSKSKTDKGMNYVVYFRANNIIEIENVLNENKEILKYSILLQGEEGLI